MKPNTIIKPRLTGSSFPKWRWLLGAAVWLGMAVVFYAFLGSLRDVSGAIANWFYSSDYGIIAPNNTHLAEQNYFFAALSILFGQSLFFQFLLQKNKSFLKKRKTAYWLALVNNNYFFHLLFMVGFRLLIPLVFIGIITTSTTFHFSAIGGLVMLLLLPYLHLRTWMNISRMYINTWKTSVYAFLGITIFAFLLAQIHITDYKTVHQQLLEPLAEYRLQIDLPFAQNGDLVLNKRAYAPIYMDKNGQTAPIFQNPEDIATYIKTRAHRTPHPKYQLVTTPVFLIDTLCPMEKVHQFRQKVSFVNWKHFYGIKDKQHYQPRTYNDWWYRIYANVSYPLCDSAWLQIHEQITQAVPFETAFEKAFDYYCTSLPLPPPLLQFETADIQEVYHIHLKSNQLIINNIAANETDYKTMLDTLITSTNQTKLIYLTLENDVPYGQYIRLLDIKSGVVNAARDAAAQAKYGLSFDNINGKKRHELVNEKHLHLRFLEPLSAAEQQVYDYLRAQK